MSAVAVLVAPLRAGALNKAANYGFEASPEPGTSWTAGGTAAATENTFARITTDFHAGAASFQGRWTGTGANQSAGRYIAQAFSPAAAANVSLRAFYKRTGAGAVDAFTFRVALREGSATGTVRTSFAYTNPADSTPPTDASWQDTGATTAYQVAAGTTYYVTVEWTAQLDGAESAGAIVDDVQLNVSPVSLVATASAGTTNVSSSWAASTGSPALRATNPYQVYRGTASGGETSLAPSSTNGYSDTTTAGNTTYYYQITDFDTAGGESPASVEASVLTLPGQPVMEAYTSVLSTSLTVNWTISGPTSGLTYTVQRAASSTGPWASVTGCVGIAATACNDSGLTALTTYWYRAQAANATGSGAWATGRQATTSAPFVAEGDTTVDSTRPAVSIVNPVSGPVSANFKVQARVFSPGGVAIGSVTLHYNAATVAMTRNDAYGTAVDAGVYEYQFASLVAGNYALRAEAFNGSGSVSSRKVIVTVPTSWWGDGNLLVRDNSSQLCSDCHALASHGSGTTSNKYGSWSLACRDCHTPHSTTNLGLIRPQITPPELTKEEPARSVVFLNRNGYATGGMASPENDGVCQVCHTRTKYYRQDGTLATHETGKSCSTCHDHTKGLAGAESSGGSPCSTCHSAVYTSMTTGGTHYHKMVSDAATPYPTAAPTSGTDTSRKCIMCHVDHDLFRADPGFNTANGGRGKNLRTDITQTPTTSANFTNKDFDSTLASGGICVSCHTNEITRGYADTTAGTKTMAVTKANFAASAHTYSGSATTATFKNDGGTATFLGDCGKCHDDTSTKQYQTGYPQATHDSTLRSMTATLGITAPADPLAEKLCYRCHSLTTDTTPGGGPAKGTANKDYFNIAGMTTQSERIFQVVTNSATYPFGHPIGAASGAHKASDGEGAAANDGSLSGVTNRHASCADCHNPHAAKPVAAGQRGTVTAWAAGTAPNADTLTDSTKTWTANQWKGFMVKVLSGTGAGATSAIYGNTTNALSVELGTTVPAVSSTYVILGTGLGNGNALGGAEAAAWGLNPTFPTQPAPPNWNDGAGGPANAADLTTQYTSISTWGRTATPALQGQICIKCHSAYAYGTTSPNTPSGLPVSSNTTWSNALGGTMVQSDLANQFNPNNLSHHAVFARGKNQPLVSSASVTSTYNPTWPKFTGDGGTINVATAACSTPPCNVTLNGSTWPITVVPGWFIYVGSATPAQATAGWYEVVAVTSTTVLTVDRATPALSAQNFMLTAGLGSNFVPPWGPWSTLQCSDCHSSDVNTDPFGPHGSGTKWSLTKAPTQAFLFYNGTGSTPTNVVAFSNAPTDANNFCLNCHRRDVYGDYNFTSPGSASYARQSHPIDLGKDHSLTVKPKWGIVCMNCHGGARSGTIHGTNLGKGNNGTTVLSYSGKRLLAGSNWYGVSRSTTAAGGACWTKGSADNVDNCGHTHSNVTFLSGTNGQANYDYDTNP